MRIAFLGAGAMGSRMASRLIQAGHDVRIYNRTSEGLREKINGEFKLFRTPREAVENAEIIFSMVTDDQASKSIWCDPRTGALNGVSTKAILLECSTVSAGWMHELASLANKQGVEFLDAPVLGSLPQAESGQLIFTLGGKSATVERVRDLLKILGGKIFHAGEIGSGTAVKLAANTYFAAQLVGLKSALEIAQGEDVSTKDLLELFSEIPAMSPAMKGICGLILAKDLNPRFTTELIAKDLSYAKQLVEKERTELLIALENEFTHSISSGYGKENITSIFKKFMRV